MSWSAYRHQHGPHGCRHRLLGTRLPTYTDFQRMLTELDPDGLIIATNDASHAEYGYRPLTPESA